MVEETGEGNKRILSHRQHSHIDQAGLEFVFYSGQRQQAITGEDSNQGVVRYGEKFVVLNLLATGAGHPSNTDAHFLCESHICI